MSESSYQLPNEGGSGKFVRFIELLVGGLPRLHEVNIPATPDGELYDARGGFANMVVLTDVAIAVTASAFTSQICKVAMIVADFNNTDWILIGDATNQPIQLQPGDKISLPIDNTGKIYRKSVSGTQSAAIMAMY